MMKKVLFYLALIIVVLAVIFGLYFLVQTILPAGASDEDVTFSISSGQSVSQIAFGLKENNFIRDGFVFKIHVLLTGESDSLQAGNYLLNQRMSLAEVLDKLVAGEITSNEVRLTFPEGWRADQIGEYLESLNLVTEENYQGYVEEPDTREYLSSEYYEYLTSKPSDQGIEGFLYPDTYLVFQDATSPEIIKSNLIILIKS